MPDYQNGKIYKIISLHTDKCYIGSTTVKYLSQRLKDHRNDFKRGVDITSKHILELGDYEIVLLELFPCNSKDELHARERHYVETLDCVNKCIPIRSKEEIKEIKKEYHLENKERFCEKSRIHYLKNKEEILKKGIEYRFKNIDKIKERKKIRTICDCGLDVRKNDISRHKKTKKHLDLMETQSSL